MLSAPMRLLNGDGTGHSNHVVDHDRADPLSYKIDDTVPYRTEMWCVVIVIHPLIYSSNACICVLIIYYVAIP